MSDNKNPKKRFFKNKTAVVGFVLILMYLIIVLSGYLFLPDSSTHANHQIPEYSRVSPGTKILYLTPQNNNKESLFWFILGKTSKSWIPLETDRLTIKVDTLFYDKINAGQNWILIPYLFYEPDISADFSRENFQIKGKYYQISEGKIKIQTKQGFTETSLIELQKQIKVQHFTYLLGSDMYGRDILSRLLLGARMSIAIGFFSMAFSLTLGVLAGVWAGWGNPWTDQLLTWVMTIVWSVPTLLLAIAVAFVMGKGFFALILAIGLTSWVDIARMVKIEVQRIKNQLFVEAAFSLGFSDIRILFRHIVPNMIPILLILSCVNFASAILLEAGLSFLGLGVPAPIPTWGSMIYEGYSFIVMQNGKWLAIFPGVAIISLVLSLHWLANGLRDAWDIKS